MEKHSEKEKHSDPTNSSSTATISKDALRKQIEFPESQASPKFLRKRLKNQLERYPYQNITEESFKRIFQKLPKILNSLLLDELKKEYGRATREILIDMTLCPFEFEKKIITPKLYQKMSSPMISFLEAKKSIEGNILYYFPFIRELVSEAEQLLPPVFIDCEKYSCFKGFYHPDILLNMMEKEVDREDLRMEFDWFGKLFMHLSDKDFFLEWPQNKISKFINLVIQITKTIALDRIYDTLRALLSFFTDPKTTPKIAMQVYHSYDGRIIISPSAADVYNSYCKLMRRVYEMGKNFVHFEMFHLKKGRRGNISIEKYDSVKDAYENKVKEFVLGIYQQVTEYYEKLSEKFLELIDDSKTSYEKLSTMKMIDLINTADHYILVKGTINEMESNTYFSHFKANNKALIKSLLFITEARIDQIMNEVLKYHVEYCERSCAEFSGISSKAIKVPETTEQLIDLAKFMKFVKTEHLKGLRINILNYLELLYKVMEIITVSQTYLDMMGLVLGWVTYMESVIEQNSSMLEVSKITFEERLNKVTEKLNEDLENFSSEELDGLDHLDDYSLISSYVLHIMKCLRKVQKFDETAKWINKEELLFELTLSTYPELDEIKAFVNPFAELIFQLNKWSMVYQSIMDGSLEDLSLKRVEGILQEYNNIIYQLQKWFKSKIRQQAAENNPRRFKGNVDDSEVDNWPAPMKLLDGAQKNLEEIKEHKNLMKLLCNGKMRSSHWEEMSKIAGRDMTPYKGASLRQFINFKIEDKMIELEKISENAIKENVLKENLEKMKVEWENVYFTVKEFTESVFVIDCVDHILSLADNHFVKTMAIRSSSYVKPIEGELKSWHSKLELITRTVEEWCHVQNQWIYFKPIFSSSIISEQMPIEGSLFMELDTTYRKMVDLVKKNPLVLSFVDNVNIFPSLKRCNEKFEEIDVGVKTFLEKKRAFFPRFSFLSDDQMLKFSSEAKEPKKLPKYLKKCFSGIWNLGFDHLFNVRSIMSAEGEEVVLTTKVGSLLDEGSLEMTLVQVEDQMLITMRNLIERCLRDLNKTENMEKWSKNWPGQAILSVSMIDWTQNINENFEYVKPGVFLEHSKVIMEQIEKIILWLRKALTKSQRINLSSLVVLRLHNKNVTYRLHESNISSIFDFMWNSQLRYHWEDDVIVKLVNWELSYGYEYLGNTEYPVVTGLTERVTRSLFSVYKLRHFACLQGPTASGKIRTLKYLASALAAHCHIFDCSSRTDISSTEKMLKGTKALGAWLCFHDFDKIEKNVMCVISDQIVGIISSVREKLNILTSESESGTLSPACFICLTLSPAESGRSQLPATFQSLFRPVSMMVPDFQLICDVYLHSNGFQNSKLLGRKIITLMKMFSELLSQHHHYDFGLRRIMSIMKNATSMKMNLMEKSEEEFIGESIIKSMEAGSSGTDRALAVSLVCDIFPGCRVAAGSGSPGEHNLDSQLAKICEEEKIVVTSEFIKKANYLNEMYCRHRSLLIVGDILSGKSTLLKVLRSTTIQGKNNTTQNEINIRVINPKAVPMENLYGFFTDTKDWNDGLIGKMLREFGADEHQINWIIFDGPLSSDWVDSIQSALSAEASLCLDNGEKINMTKNTKIIFETTDLKEASPETVSRCGVVHVSGDPAAWLSWLEVWAKSLPEVWQHKSGPSKILQLLRWILPLATHFINLHSHHKSLQLGMEHSIRSICQLIDILTREVGEGVDSKNMSVWSEAVVLQSVLWALTGQLDRESRETFDEFYRQLWRVDEENPEPNSFEGELDIILPTDGLIEDNWFIFKGKGTWKYWPEVLKNMKQDEIFNPVTNLVTTLDSLKYSSILELYIKKEKPFLIFGPACSGKTSLIKTLLLENRGDLESGFLAARPTTKSTFLQNFVLSKCIKKMKGTYGPADDKRCLVFIDDINILNMEIKSQQPLELIRMFFDYGYWYDISSLEKIEIQNLNFAAALTLQRKTCEIPKRFLRHLALFRMDPLSDESLTKIFSTIAFTGLRKNGFPADLMCHSTQLVSASLRLYHSVRGHLVPSPSRPLYQFDVGDLSRIFQGILLLRKESADGKRVFLRLWVHEVLRVVDDRLFDVEDRDWLFAEIKRLVQDCFKEEMDEMLDGLEETSQIEEENEPIKQEVKQSTLSKLFFTTALDADMQENQKYEEVSIDSFLTLLSKTQEDYNIKNKEKMKLVLFQYGLEHVSRICRVLSLAGGCGLLVGLPGSGRHSLVRLAAFLLRHQFFLPDLAKPPYNMEEDWKKYIKQVLREAGAKKKQCVLMITERDLENESAMEEIHWLLSTGEIPNLYSLNEIQDIVEVMQSEKIEKMNSDIKASTVFEQFLRNSRRNLHIIICLNSNISNLRFYLRKYPSLVKNCTIDWFEGWPETALEKVAEEYLEELRHPEDVTLKSIVTACKYFHVTARDVAGIFFEEMGRQIQTSPPCFIHFLELYKYWSEKKRAELELSKGRYLDGLEKLEFAASQVEIMQSDLESLQPALRKAAQETTEMLKVIERETSEVEKASERVRLDEEVANLQAIAAMELKTECENDLALAIPILEDAVAALNTLKPADITLVKSMKNPPETVKLVLAAVCVMRGMKADRLPDPRNPGRRITDYWGPSKRLLGDMTFLQQLKDYDKDNIPASIMKTVRAQYLNHKDFKPKVVAKASSAAEGLCKWVIALDKYDVVVKEVAPKKEKLGTAEREYSETMAILEEKRNLLKGLEDKLAELKNNLKSANERKIRLQDEVVLCSNKLQKAQRIIGSLGGEKGRWRDTAKYIEDQYNEIPGNMLVSCGILAYLTQLTPHFRKRTIAEWCEFCSEIKIPLAKEFRLEKCLSAPVLTENWIVTGLPNDWYSLENAVILNTTNRWPLIIDPQNEANKWIKKLEKLNNIQVLKSLEDSKEIISSCQEHGYPVLYEIINKTDEEAIDSFLAKFSSIGDSRDYLLNKELNQENCTFRLYITVRCENPSFSHEIHKKLTIVNFELTTEGIADQILEIVVEKERPELLEERQNLMVESSRNKRDLQSVEDGILLTLSSVMGNILEDETAVNSLDISKALAEKIRQREAGTKKNRDDIDEFRQGLREVGECCAPFYNSTAVLNRLHRLYTFSLEWFIGIFKKSMDVPSKSTNYSREERIKLLKNTFYSTLFTRVNFSLFEEHKLLYSFILCKTLLILEGRLEECDVTLLELAGRVGMRAQEDGDSSAALASLASANPRLFKDFHENFKSNFNTWNKICETKHLKIEDISEELFPKTMSQFQKIIVMTILRGDRVYSEIRSFIKNEMGAKFISSEKLDMDTVFEESDPNTPIIVLSTGGIDPMENISPFVKKMKKTDEFMSLSVDRTQIGDMVAEARRKGGWLCIETCDGSRGTEDWLIQLAVQLEAGGAVSPEFRLWILAETLTNYPFTILQRSVKILSEEGRNLRDCLIERYNSEPISNMSFFESCPTKERLFSRLIFSITFFHGVLSERKQFGTTGWSRPYHFTSTDHFLSLLQLQMLVSSLDPCPVEKLQILLSESFYGGKVTDAWDRRTLNVISKQFIQSSAVLCEEYSPASEKRDLYIVPVRNDYKHYLQFVANLPEESDPEIHEQSHCALYHRDLEMSKSLTRCLQIYSGWKEEEGDLIEESYANFQMIFDKIPAEFNMTEASLKYSLNPDKIIKLILLREMCKLNGIITIVNESVRRLLEGFSDLALLTKDLEEMSNEIRQNKIPQLWRKLSFRTLKSLGSFMTDLAERKSFLQEWYEGGDLRDYWLGGLSHPRAFLAGAVQDFASSRGLFVGDLELDWDFLQEERSNHLPDKGLYIHGLYLEGADWSLEGRHLKEEEGWIRFRKLPAVQFIPELKSTLRRKTPDGYACPVYETPARNGRVSSLGISENFVTSINLESQCPSDHWTRRGVAITCQKLD